MVLKGDRGEAGAGQRTLNLRKLCAAVGKQIDSVTAIDRTVILPAITRPGIAIIRAAEMCRVQRACTPPAFPYPHF
jgi:hypothetical protein